MMTMNRIDALTMTGAGMAGFAPGLLLELPIAGIGGALVAGGLAATARAMRRRGTQPPAVQPLIKELRAVHENEELIATLTRDIARSERYGEAFTVTIVKAEGFDEMSEPARDALAEHLRGSVERVTRASDSWFELGSGRFAVLLERCTSSEAASFGERLMIAASSRPLVADGARVPVTVLAAHTQYDPHQFVGARDFLAAAVHARFAVPGSRKRLVSDGRKLREQFYGKDRTAGAA